MKRSRAYASLLLSLALVFSCVAIAPATTQSDLNAAKQAAEDAREAADAATDLADELKAETQALDNQLSVLENDVRALDPQVAEATQRSNQLSLQVDDLRSSISLKQMDIAETTEEFEQQRGILSENMTSSYKQGAFFYLDLLLDAKDFSDLIARTTLVQRVMDHNNDIAEVLADTKASLEQQKADLDNDLETVSTLRAEAQAVESSLRTLQSQRQAKVNQQEAIYDQKAALYEETAANATRLKAIAEAEEAESQRIENELRNSSSSGSGEYNGVMAWPVPGFYRVSSPFGYRIHPIFGTRKMHTGIDIGRNLDPAESINGAAIVAAGDGEVIYATYSSGYGNTVMIDHGDGVVSLYAHQRSGGIMVNSGQQVSKGDRIGTVGSTGYSTGPHLHFEVRVNGTPVDPMSYLE
jgi:murein DD-endopeptidase MepM/ murein hydrolase activator NlpD